MKTVGQVDGSIGETGNLKLIVWSEKQNFGATSTLHTLTQPDYIELTGFLNFSTWCSYRQVFCHKKQEQNCERMTTLMWNN